MEEFLLFLTIMTLQKQNNTDEWNPQRLRGTQRKSKAFAIWQIESQFKGHHVRIYACMEKFRYYK